MIDPKTGKIIGTCSCGQPLANHHSQMFRFKEVDGRTVNDVEDMSDRCDEWVSRGGVESRCMNKRNHAQYGWPATHSLDLRNRHIGRYQVICRAPDYVTPGGNFIPMWRVFADNQVQMITEKDLVKGDHRDPRML